MANHVQIVLREDVDNLGRAGEIVRVRAGYARNYLVPRDMAAVATVRNVSQLEHEKQRSLARAAKLQKDSEGVAAALAEVTVQITKQAGAEGKLFGSVTAQDVARALKDLGHELDRKRLEMPKEVIKELGTYELSAKLTQGVVASFKLEVTAES